MPYSAPDVPMITLSRSEEHTSELQSQSNLVCRLLLEKKKQPITPAVPSLTTTPELPVNDRRHPLLTRRPLPPATGFEARRESHYAAQTSPARRETTTD